MKTMLRASMFLVTLLTCVYGFSEDNKKYGFYIPAEKEELYGTWVNGTYSGMLAFSQKIVMNYWGDWEKYSKVEDTFFNSGWTVSEYVIGYDGFPTSENMNSKNPYYRIYNREE